MSKPKTHKEIKADFKKEIEILKDFDFEITSALEKHLWKFTQKTIKNYAEAVRVEEKPTKGDPTTVLQRGVHNNAIQSIKQKQNTYWGKK